MKWQMSYGTKCVLVLLLIIGFFICITSPYFKNASVKGPHVSEESQGGVKKLTPPVSAFLPIVHHPLIIYVERELLPSSWIRAFEEQTGEKIEQRLLTLNNGNNIPLDGDVYSLEPRHLGVLCEKGELMPFENGEFWNGTNPIFGGHSFDLDDKWTRPWRWSPYFFYLRNLNSASTQPNAPKAYPTKADKWWLTPNSIWSNDLDLLTCLRMKDLGHSANVKHDDLWEGTYQDLSKALGNTHISSEKACWEALQEGKADISLLPALYLLRASLAQQQNYLLRAPTKGTLIEFEVLVISARTTRPDMAKKFVQFLTASEQQEKLLADTGYFPVKSRPGHEWTATLIPAPAGEWLGRSEFLTPATPIAPSAPKDPIP